MSGYQKNQKQNENLSSAPIYPPTPLQSVQSPQPSHHPYQSYPVQPQHPQNHGPSPHYQLPPAYPQSIPIAIQPTKVSNSGRIFVMACPYCGNTDPNVINIEISYCQLIIGMIMSLGIINYNLLPLGMIGILLVIFSKYRVTRCSKCSKSRAVGNEVLCC